LSHPLDRCIWHALSGPQATFAHGNAWALRYDAEYAPFAATRDDSGSSLSALHDIVPPNGRVALFTRERLSFPERLAVIRRAEVMQMTLAPDGLAAHDLTLPPGARALEPDDVPAMLDLVALTHPGPFARRTAALGRFLGVFAGGTLIAMAGERMKLDGFVEISAVCTHPDHRGQGLAAALIATLACAAFERGETPFLHAFPDNATALGVYRKLGFAMRAVLHLASVARAAEHA